MFTVFEKVSPHFNQRLFEARIQDDADSGQVLFVIDRSGSMVSAWPDVVKFAKNVIEQNDSNKNLPVIFYNDNLAFSTLGSIDERRFRPTSTTDFKKALYAVKNFAKTHKKLNVVFMTDGQDTCNVKYGESQSLLFPIFDELKLIFKTSGLDIVIHVLTFTSDVSYEIVKRISGLGSSDGLIKHVSERKDLECGFTDMLDMVLNSKHVEVVINKNPIKIQIVDGVGYCLLDANQKFAMVQYKGDFYQIQSKQSKKQEIERFYTMFEPRSLEEIELIKVELQHLDNLELMTKLDLIEDKYLNRISEEDLLKLESINHAHIFQDAKRKAKMTQRMEKNMVAFKETQKQLYFKRHQKLGGDDIICSLTQCSMSELGSNDLMGIGVEIIVTDEVVDSPTSGLKSIDFVTWDYISFMGFVDIQSQAIKSKGADAHGRFSLNSSAFTYISANNKVNAFIPLFFNEIHGERVMIMASRWLGLLFTQNLFGFDEVQYYGFCVIVFLFFQKFGDKEGKYQEILQNLIKVARMMAKQPRFIDALNTFIKADHGFRHLITPIALYFVLDEKPIPEAEFNRMLFWYHNKRIKATAVDQLSNVIVTPDSNFRIVIDYKYDCEKDAQLLVTDNTQTNEKAVSTMFRICLNDPEKASALYDITHFKLKTKKKLAAKLFRALQKNPSNKDALESFHTKVVEDFM